MSDRADSPPRRRPPTMENKQHQPYLAARTRRPKNEGRESPLGISVRDVPRHVPRTAEDDARSPRSTMRHTFESTLEHYDFRSSGRDPSDETSSVDDRSEIEPDRGESHPKTIIQISRTGSGRPPAAYHRSHKHQRQQQQSVSITPSERGILNPRVSYIAEMPRQGGSSNQQSIASTTIKQTTSPIPVSSGFTGNDANDSICATHPSTRSQSIPQPVTNRELGISQPVLRPYDNTFRICLPPPLLGFANVPRSDWKTIETYINHDRSLLEAEIKPLLTEAIRAYSVGKDEYANQCIHRIALLQQLRGLPLKTALETLANIRNREQTEAAKFFVTYDRIKAEAKGRARLLRSSNSGTAAVQHLFVTQSNLDAPSGDNPSYGSQNQAIPVAPTFDSYETSGAQITAGTRANGSAENDNHDRKSSRPGSSYLNSHTRYPVSSGFPSDRMRVDHHAERPSEMQTTSGPKHLEPSSPGPPTIGPNLSLLSQEGPNDGPRMSAQQPPPGPYESNEVDESLSSMSIKNRRQSVSTISLDDISVTGENTLYLKPVGQGKVGLLDPSYRIHPRTFYTSGRIFAVLWHEPASATQTRGHTGTNQVLTAGRYNEPIYSTIRRMVVVRESHGYCVCIQINTYSGRGLKKFDNRKGVINWQEVNNHSIIHMTDTNPTCLQDEPRSAKRSIAVVKASAHQRLAPESRLCYSMPHTVQHNVKAMNIGHVASASLPYLIHYYKQAQD